MASAWAKKVVNLAPLCGVRRRLESDLGAEQRLGLVYGEVQEGLASFFEEVKSGDIPRVGMFFE